MEIWSETYLPRAHHSNEYGITSDQLDIVLSQMRMRKPIYLHGLVIAQDEFKKQRLVTHRKTLIEGLLVLGIYFIHVKLIGRNGKDVSSNR